VKRVYVVAEGPTERSFIEEVLAPSLWDREIYLHPRILGPRGHKGGNTKYARVKKDVLVLLKQDQNAHCTTMLDLYGLGAGWPGLPLPPSLGNHAKVSRLENAMAAELAAEIPELRPDLRFLPYLQLHEYEGLLFSDPHAFASAIGKQDLGQRFQEIRDHFDTPEDINDNSATAPSKRVLGLYGGYRKVLEGTIAAKAVGIERIRAECPHFRAWIESLESLAPVVDA
jgi:hypothetical protein